MITFYNDETYEVYCLSTDTKPLLGKNSSGSILLEIDTGKNMFMTLIINSELNTQMDLAVVAHQMSLKLMSTLN